MTARYSQSSQQERVSLGPGPGRACAQRDAAKENRARWSEKGLQKGRWRTQAAESVMFQGQGGVGGSLSG